MREDYFNGEVRWRGIIGFFIFLSILIEEEGYLKRIYGFKVICFEAFSICPIFSKA